MGCGHHTNVNFLRSCTSQPLELALLQHAEQFRLQLQWDIAYFVQEQRALVRDFDPANLLSDGTGEGATFMAKKFAFEQPGGNGGTVELYKGSIPARTVTVNGARNELFAGTGLA